MMYTTYHLKPITIIVEEEDDLSDEIKVVLDQRLREDEATYLTAEDSINLLYKRYGL